MSSSDGIFAVSGPISAAYAAKPQLGGIFTRSPDRVRYRALWY